MSTKPKKYKLLTPRRTPNSNENSKEEKLSRKASVASAIAAVCSFLAAAISATIAYYQFEVTKKQMEISNRQLALEFSKTEPRIFIENFDDYKKGLREITLNIDSDGKNIEIVSAYSQEILSLSNEKLRCEFSIVGLSGSDGFDSGGIKIKNKNSRQYKLNISYKSREELTKLYETFLKIHGELFYNFHSYHLISVSYTDVFGVARNKIYRYNISEKDILLKSIVRNHEDKIDRFLKNDEHIHQYEEKELKGARIYLDNQGQYVPTAVGGKSFFDECTKYE